MKSDQLQEQLRQLEQRHNERTLELRRLTSELFMAEERSRRAIASDLHDHIGQALAMIRFKLMELQGNAVFSGVDDNIDELKTLLDQTIRSTRSLTFEVSPPMLYELGLEAAIEWLSKQFSEKYRLPIRFHDDKQSRSLTDDLKIALFRSVSELLMNTVKHAEATHATVSISHEDASLRIKVEDDGKGFDVLSLSASKGKHFGLFSIKERLKYLGGKLEIASEAGKGSRITIWAP